MKVYRVTAQFGWSFWAIISRSETMVGRYLDEWSAIRTTDLAKQANGEM
jgi:hypothetical protein